MNLKRLIAAAAVIAAGAPVFAGEYVEYSDFVSTKTRAEVVAELRQAQAERTMAAANPEYVEFMPIAGTARSRADVRAEAIESAKNHGGNMQILYFGG